MTRTELRKQIGDKIRKIRKKLHLTQLEFITDYNDLPPVDLQITVKDLSKYETGTGGIPSDKYVKLLSMQHEEDL